MSKFLDVFWFTQPVGSFGIVIMEDEYTKVRKAYIGGALGENEDEDIRNICSYGAKISLITLRDVVNLLESKS